MPENNAARDVIQEVHTVVSFDLNRFPKVATQPPAANSNAEALGHVRVVDVVLAVALAVAAPARSLLFTVCISYL